MNDVEGLRLKKGVEGGRSRDKGGNLPRYPVTRSQVAASGSIFPTEAG